MKKQQHLSDAQVHLIAKALADPRRYDILKRLAYAAKTAGCNGPTACGAVRESLDVTPATLSHHMKELETAGLITATRSGKFVSYLLRQDVLSTFLERVKIDLA